MLRPVWPGSHQRIWEEQWKAYEERGELHTHSRRGVTERSEWFGMFDSIHEDTVPFDTHAPSGSVVLWVRASSCPLLLLRLLLLVLLLLLLPLVLEPALCCRRRCCCSC